MLVEVVEGVFRVIEFVGTTETMVYTLHKILNSYFQQAQRAHLNPAGTSLFSRDVNCNSLVARSV